MGSMEMRSHLHDESESTTPHPNPSPNPNPYPAGAKHTPSGNHVISISGKSEKQDRKKNKKNKEKSSYYEIEPSATTPAAESGVTSPGPKRLEDERQGIKGQQSNSFPETIERRIVTRNSKKVKNLCRAHPCNWCFTRRAFWHMFLHQSLTRRPRRIRAILRRRGNKITKTADNNYQETQSQDSGSKRRKTNKTADVSDSSVSVQRESMTESENDCSVSKGPMTVPETYPKAADIQPMWRPPKPEENDMWALSCVKTNGQGRERLISGDTLLEIFNIGVDLRGRKKTCGYIHGNITLDCTVYKTVIFNCDKKNALMIEQKGSLPLKGSDVAPLGFDSVGIFVDLKIDDEKLCKDVLVWDPCYGSTDVWLYDTLKGKNGSVHVTFAVMKQAWLAELDVKLIQSAKQGSSKLYGDIVVYINNMRYLRYFAFNKGSDYCSIVKPQESIPLSRSLFSCRCGSSLVVKVDLWDSDTKESFVRGALLFPPEYYGDSVGEISSPCGKVEVKVNWVFYLNHSKTRQALRLDCYA